MIFNEQIEISKNINDSNSLPRIVVFSVFYPIICCSRPIKARSFLLNHKRQKIDNRVQWSKTTHNGFACQKIDFCFCRYFVVSVGRLYHNDEILTGQLCYIFAFSGRTKKQRSFAYMNSNSSHIDFRQEQLVLFWFYNEFFACF